MPDPSTQPEKEVIVATEKSQVSFRRIIAGLSIAAVAGLVVFAWQENMVLAVLAAIAGFVFGYLSGLLIY